MKIFFHPRVSTANSPGGLTVTKRLQLPKGDFGITEYLWGRVSLWFINKDKFTADERQNAFESLKKHPKPTKEGGK